MSSEHFANYLFVLELKLVWLGILLVVFATAVFYRRKLAQFLPKKWKQHLKKHTLNPIFSPPPFSEWESVGTFNPAAIQDNEGRVHLIYRAIGGDGVSRFGYGRSEDGYDFSYKSPYPVFAMARPRAGIHAGIDTSDLRWDPVMYPSGGSWGGAEDPRMVRLDGKIYITFSAFDGWDFIRMAVSHIAEEDFFSGRWKWSKPLLISPPGEIHKNWVIFPEKINGKFAILHNITPDVQIDYVNRLEDLAFGFQKIKSRHNKEPRQSWDTWVRGVGPPPIKTDKGWLILYHAIERHESHAYKLGAMLLDLKNPTKVIARSSEPILCPTEWYENDSKPGIVYACGAIIKDDRLIVYYGGGDKHVCAADISLKELFKLLFKK